MRRITTLWAAAVMCASSAVATTASAQQWSPQQQEVLQHIQACWDAWPRGYDQWASVCRPVEGNTYWRTSEGAPFTLDYWRKTAATRSTTLKVLWTDRRPVAIQIDRDIAIVHFYALWETVDDGRRVENEMKCMEVFRKVDGRWHFVSGMSVPTD